ncbi:hypothetical protein [Caldimonas brevitalea]|uniref:Uncharacterized protein n=1 Tax=Caldimonas brevitalea TaxID=413882 RepID=A0A0G3BVD1_9BURK|nr:hypothetical protein [Caldimonas brevitalea]AKJ31988.1 hypothetical protein AAW51_5297 [Caldimonas brevitalea]
MKPAFESLPAAVSAHGLPTPRGPSRSPVLWCLAVAVTTGCGGGGDSGTSGDTATDGGAASPSTRAPDDSASLRELPQSLARPGPHNTGVPAGTVLRPSGPLQLTIPGQVITGLDVVGCVNVKAPRVVIRRTRIRCGSYYPVRLFDNASLTIEDSEIDGSSSAGKATSGIAFGNYTARRVNIHGTADGVKAEQNVLLEASWIHDLYLGNGDHADGVQTIGNGSNVTVRGNFIDIVDRGRGHGGSPSSSLQVGIERGPNSNWLISGNWLYGGGWVINADAGTGTHNRVVNNRFGRGVTPTTGERYPKYGAMVLYGPWQASGNVWDDNGAPVGQ